MMPLNTMIRQTASGAIGRLIELGCKYFNIVALRLHIATLKLIYNLRMLRQLRVKVWIVGGREKSSGLPLSILCVANDMIPTHRGWDARRNFNYLLEKAFGGTFKEHYICTTWIWKIPEVVKEKRQQSAFAVVQVHKIHQKLLFSDKWFYIPNWVFGEVEIPLDSVTTKASSLRSDFRRIRKYALHYEVTKDPGQFFEFYHNMYVPYISAVHKHNANIITYQEMIKETHHLDLLLVKKQSVCIAGILIIYENNTPRLWVIGVKNGDPHYLNFGAVAALYHFSFHYLHDKGFSKVNLGYSRAFLNDGVLQYKKKLAQRIIGASPHRFALKIISGSQSAKHFLKNNPFIFENYGSKCGAIFIDAERKCSTKELQNINREYSYSGLDKLCIYFIKSGKLFIRNSLKGI
jgi:hypothetical protein